MVCLGVVLDSFGGCEKVCSGFSHFLLGFDGGLLRYVQKSFGYA